MPVSPPDATIVSSPVPDSEVQLALKSAIVPANTSRKATRSIRAVSVVTSLAIAVSALARAVCSVWIADRAVLIRVSSVATQAEPEYLDLITDEPDGDGDGAYGDEGGGTGDDLYDRAVAVVTRDRKASTSYVQRRLQIGYNRAATLIERMEQEGVVSPANHAGKRDVLAGPPPMV